MTSNAFGHATIVTQQSLNAEQAKVGESLVQQSALSRTSSWPEMLAQFKDKKSLTTDFKMAVNGEVLHSISEPGKEAAIF